MSKPESKPLWDYQFKTIFGISCGLDGGETRNASCLPTGAGKTLIAAQLHKRAIAMGMRSIFVVPRLSLIEQTYRSFEAEGINHIGVIQGRHFRTDPSAPVQIASAQTLARRNIPKANLIIIDECHLQFRTINDWMGDPEWQEIPFIGLSATRRKAWAGIGKRYFAQSRFPS